KLSIGVKQIRNRVKSPNKKTIRRAFMKFLLLGIRGLHYFGRIVHLNKERHTTARACTEKNRVSQTFFPFLEFPGKESPAGAGRKG
ncbi:MAG TPA: hypothetical protein PK653_04310, partial [Syntrophales bacterium]|nr:hypothetical protein [Syntrophales bacterium]